MSKKRIMRRSAPKTGIAGTAIILAILAIVLLQVFAIMESAYHGTPTVLLGPALSMFLVLAFILLPFKYVFNTNLNSFKDLFIIIVAIILMSILIHFFPNLVPSIFKQGFSVVGLG